MLVLSCPNKYRSFELFTCLDLTDVRYNQVDKTPDGGDPGPWVHPLSAVMVAASVSGADTPGTLYSVHRGPGAETYDHFTLFAADLVSSCLMCFVLHA